MGKGSGGGGTQTTTVNPFGPSIPSLERGLEIGNRLMDRRGLAPQAYSGPRVADLRPEQMEGFRSMMGEARQLGGPGGLNDQTMNAVGGMLGAGNAGMTQQAGASGLSAIMGDLSRQGQDGTAAIYSGLDQVKQNVLGDVIPQVSSMFSDTGGLDSSAAMDTVGRAASQAIAPIEYGAYNAAQDRQFAGNQAALNRGMQVAGMGNDLATRGATLAPGVAGMQFLPGQMMQQVGGIQQQQRQNEIGARMDQYNQNANQPYDNLVRYMQLAQGTAGFGNTTTQPYNGPSGGQQAVGGALSGAAAGSMIGGPWGALAGGGLGLLGAFL